MNSNQANLAFEGEIQNTFKWLGGRVKDFCGYSTHMLTDRLMQRVVEMACWPYVNMVADRLNSGADGFPADGTWVDCGSARFELGSGRIDVTLVQQVRNHVDFLRHWGYCLTGIVTLAKSPPPELPAVLVFGVGDESLFQDGRDNRFVEYCRGGPIDPLRKGGRFLIQSARSGAVSTDSRFSYSRFPIVDLLRTARLGFTARLKMLFGHLALLFAYACHALRRPLLSLLARDIAYSGICAEMERRGLIDSIVLTGSNYMRQELWLRALPQSKVHMVWYSQSAKPFSYVADGIESDTPNLRWIRIGTLWLWTHALADYAKRLIPEAEIKVVGPILWYLPELKCPPKDRLCIAIFDVPALTDGIALSVGLFPNYFHAANLRAFVDDIVALKAELEARFCLPVSFILKTKRQYHPTNDRLYFDYLEHLGMTGTISLAHHETNMYALVSGSHLVMVYPFSSPAYVANYLKVPSIYYDPTGSIIRCDFGDPPSMIQFANTREELRDLSIGALQLTTRQQTSSA